MSNHPIPDATTMTTMTPQQKVLYDMWSNYYNIRDRKGTTRYDLLQHQPRDQSILYNSYSLASDASQTTAKTRAILHDFLANSATCIASSMDIPLDSNTWNIGVDTCRDGARNCINAISDRPTKISKLSPLRNAGNGHPNSDDAATTTTSKGLFQKDQQKLKEPPQQVTDASITTTATPAIDRKSVV